MATQSTLDPYWSRQSATYELADRVDPVVWNQERVDSEGALDDDQLAAYQKNGYHHDAQLIKPAEADLLLHEANQLAEEAAQTREPGVIREPGSGVVRSLFRLHLKNQRFRDLAKDPRIVTAVRQMIGDDIYVHQSRINFKPAFDGKEFFWHSDFETWHVEDGMPRMQAVSVSISLSETNEFNGPLVVLPGSHKTYVRCVGETPENHFEQSLKKQEYGVPSREAMKRLVLQHPMVAPKGRPGSAVFFECNLLHGSSGNMTPWPRTNFFIVYNSLHNRVVEPFGDQPPRPEYLSERNFTPVQEL